MEGCNQKKRVVIVGGGIAGGLLAKSLQSLADVVLIDPKEYFEIPWAKLRSMVEPSFAERSVFNHVNYFKSGRIVTSSAVNITETEVLTAGGHRITYDYLVIATGHADSFPMTRADRLKQFEEDNKKIKSAKSILIIGGGPTGVELAGEIAVDFPEKKVTLVHRGQRLLDFIEPKASVKALYWLMSKKVEVLLDQSVNLDSISNGGSAYETSTGETIAADCHFVCAGSAMLASSWLKDTVLKESLDLRGRLMVDEYLRVTGHDNVFAIGDITNIPEIKQGFCAQRHAMVVTKNIKLLIEEGDKNRMATYKASSPIAMVSLGRKEAVAQFPLVTVSGCIPGMIKSRDLFVGKTRKQMGLDPHGAS
ncbi:uncharacterized protein LOC131252415 [Magnolia sinica]|uniref:uncharacterized protein LOC131252415 n=1 Tax=Magnolia sinica TaxID=86752 RepID=UPI00265B4461|nr:uncharacterized protein LOC131252415 [Magnolia sinica]XP_058109058.1 uncharacterized protein LOC131252415 [Magnolia sinica]